MTTKTKDIVTIICYGSAEDLERADAIRKYSECAQKVANKAGMQKYLQNSCMVIRYARTGRTNNNGKDINGRIKREPIQHVEQIKRVYADIL